MPIYEYQCEKCGSCFEKLIFSSNDKSVDCPDCGAKKVKRLLSSTCSIGGSTDNCGPSAGSGFS